MTTVFNLLCKAFIAILDILLLDFFIKNSSIYIYNKIKKLCYVVYIFCLIGLMISTHFVMYNFIYYVVFILIGSIYFSFKYPITIFIKNITLFTIFKFFISYLVNIIFSWNFNTTISFDFIHYTAPYILFTQCISRFFIYISLIFLFKNEKQINIKKFKTLCIFVFLYFSLTFIFSNDILFFIPTVGRTYIFTVVISIIALICFDRMQTKYEKDKHLQESIIQNLEKEKEFNQQREQQQKEIRKINHNLNNILIILQSHLEKEEYEEAKDYIEQNLKTHVEAYQALTHTGIAAIDGALNAHIQSIKEKGIQYDEDISKILHLGSIVPGDLALIISLALDNAKEACENIDGEKHISLKLQSKQTHVILYIENSIPEGSHPTFHKTSKKDKIAHGFGVSSIKEMAERYHGEAKYEVKHDQVILRVVLQK